MWYDVGKTLSYNALINMVIGGRGIGKTYGLKERALKNWIKKEKQFAYVRRYENELDMVKKTLFSDINGSGKYPMVEYSDGCYCIDGNIIGYPIPLSTSHKLKSASYPDVTLIIFDEFIIDTSLRVSYLKNEVKVFLDLIETIGRLRDDYIVFMLANSLSIVNPYTQYFDLINKTGNVRRTNDGLVLMEIIESSEEFKGAKVNTRFGRLINNTEYGDMAISNQFILDKDSFIAQRSLSSRYYLTIKHKGNYYGVWLDLNTGIYYASKSADINFPLKICRTLDDHDSGIIMVKSINDNMRWSYVVKALTKGNLYFDCLETKYMVLEVMGYG